MMAFGTPRESPSCTLGVEWAGAPTRRARLLEEIAVGRRGVFNLNVVVTDEPEIGGRW